MIDQSSTKEYDEFRDLFRDRLSSLQKDSWPCRVSDLRVYDDTLYGLFRYTYDKEHKLSDGMIKKAIDWVDTSFDEISMTMDEHCGGEITDKFVSDLEQGFNLAIKDLKISQYVKGREKDSIEEPSASKQKGATSGKKRTPQYDISMRKRIVQAFAESSPNSKGTNLDDLTCKELDKRRVEVSNNWRLKYKVGSWMEGYDNPKVRKLIQKMFSKDRSSIS